MLNRSFIMLFLLVFVLVIPVIIGIFVFRDAGRRGMNQLLWALVATLVPNLLGLIAYLIVASQHKPQRECPGCRNQVEQDFTTCPHCGFQLQESCPQCHKGVAPDWNICPSCGHTLHPAEMDQ